MSDIAINTRQLSNSWRYDFISVAFKFPLKYQAIKMPMLQPPIAGITPSTIFSSSSHTCSTAVVAGLTSLTQIVEL